MTPINKETSIRSLVHASVEAFATGFQGRHEGEKDNPNGTINMKIHNIFISTLGSEIQYYTALVRSFDSSLGNMLEKLAINIARLFYEVYKDVEGHLSISQTRFIAELLEKYKRHEKKPEVSDYSRLRIIPGSEEKKSLRHESDYYLINQDNGKHHLIELKIGGDLDNKKARSEKEAILEQYAILSNNLPEDAQIVIHFATAYNRFGEGKPWKQERVKQFFAEKELLIGNDFWDFICKSKNGYNIVIDQYKKDAKIIKNALDGIKRTYLG